MNACGERRNCGSDATSAAPARADPTGSSGSRSSDGANVRRLRALLAGGDVELHTLVLLQRTETVRLDGREVDEDVGRAAVGGDEAEALLAVEPLHGALCHVRS